MDRVSGWRSLAERRLRGLAVACASLWASANTSNAEVSVLENRLGPPELTNVYANGMHVVASRAGLRGRR